MKETASDSLSFTHMLRYLQLEQSGEKKHWSLQEYSDEDRCSQDEAFAGRKLRTIGERGEEGQRKKGGGKARGLTSVTLTNDDDDDVVRIL